MLSCATNLFGMSFYGNGIQGQHARFRSDRSLDLFFQSRFVGVQLLRINFQLCESHNAVIHRFGESTPARLLGQKIEDRRNQLCTTLPIRRVVEPADVAALAVHTMTNTALTGETYDIDGGQ